MLPFGTVVGTFTTSVKRAVAPAASPAMEAATWQSQPVAPYGCAFSVDGGPLTWLNDTSVVP